MKVHTTSSRASYREFDGNEDWPGFNAVVSLHAHTHHSREVMACLPQYFAKIPLVGSRFERERQTALERTGDSFDFSKGWWHPPVGPRQVFESEVQQIEQRFGLSSIVSVTDHDDVAAGIELQAMYAVCRAPISFEWTVPYGDGFFHLGVHNLPPDDARAWFARLASFTAEPGAEPLGDLLADLHARPEMLVVFNHPMWDLADVGGSQHTRLLHHFLAEHRSTLHALELNGYRSGKENDRVRALAKSAGLPLISGGDRHGCAPNSLLNVTAAQSFAEFAEEIRAGVTHVVVMPEYRQHIVTRTLAAASDVLRRYPRHPVGRQHWTDRVSCDWGGSVRPLSFHWPHGGPLWVRSSVKAFQLITSPVLLPIIRVALETIDP
jgi:hypothetical protein